jgi:hypothetical protein
MNWKNEVNRINKAAFSWPKGWSTREEIAEQLECSPDRVREVLAPGIKTGDIEVKDFQVWEDGRKIRKTGYRKVMAEADKPSKAAKPKPKRRK